MQQDTILLSGASGFLGSHLAEDISLNGYRVIALIRNHSDLSRCKESSQKNVILVNMDSPGFAQEIGKYAPTCFIHAAWQGVAINGRDEWDRQIENIPLTLRLLKLANELEIKKVIAFGSQAEYGHYSGRIGEEAACNPTTAYGAAKLATLHLFKSFCEVYAMNWFWFRIFSIYGAHQDDQWLIPSVIKHARENKSMDLTACEQRYDYIYSKDFSCAIMKVLETTASSGVFNLSSNGSVQLKAMIREIIGLTNTKAVFNFGALPYRPDQVMHMEGDSTKFNQTFGFRVTSEFEKNMQQLLKYYQHKN